MPAGETNLELLRAAIARRAGAVLSLPIVSTGTGQDVQAAAHAGAGDDADISSGAFKH